MNYVINTDKKINSLYSKLIFLVFPAAILFIWHWLRHAAGPFYLTFPDPSYVYLVSSLNLAQFSSPYHFDHPGTTLQMIGAILMKIKFIFSSSTESISGNVLNNPEDYLYLINIISVLLICSALIWLGIFVSKLSGSVYIGLLAQLSCFTSEQILSGLNIISPENVLVAVSVFFLGLIFYYLYKSDPYDRQVKFILLWSLVCGAGIATKFNFFPLVFIPLFLIKGISKKALFTFLTVLVFIIFTLPVITKYKVMFGWLFKLFSGNEMYGRGEDEVVSVPYFFDNLKAILSSNLFFLAAYFSSLASTVYFCYVKFTNKIIFNDDLKKKFKLLAGIFAAMTLQILLVAKHYKAYYMLPSLMLSMVTIVLILSILPDILKKNYGKRIYKIAFMILLVILLAKNVLHINSVYSQLTESRLEAKRVNEAIEKYYNSELVIPTFSSSNSNYGLALGLVYSGKRKEEYKNILSDKLRTLIYFDPWQKKMFSFAPGTDSSNIFATRKSLIFHSIGSDNVKNFSDLLQKKYGLTIDSITQLEVFKNGDEIYRFNFE